MHKYEISIKDVRSISLVEEHQNIGVARDATIRKALDRLLEAPSPKTPQTATCNVVEQGSLEERTFEIRLSIIDLI